MAMTGNLERETILIIDDEAGVRHSIAQAIELAGYQVLEAQDGNAGFKMARENQVALIILDLRLPDVDGWSILCQIKSEPKLSKIPIIIVTGSDEIGQRDKALRMGATEYFTKPLRLAGLREVIRRILS